MIPDCSHGWGGLSSASEPRCPCHTQPPRSRRGPCAQTWSLPVACHPAGLRAQLLHWAHAAGLPCCAEHVPGPWRSQVGPDLWTCVVLHPQCMVLPTLLCPKCVMLPPLHHPQCVVLLPTPPASPNVWSSHPSCLPNGSNGWCSIPPAPPVHGASVPLHSRGTAIPPQYITGAERSHTGDIRISHRPHPKRQQVCPPPTAALA